MCEDSEGALQYVESSSTASKESPSVKSLHPTHNSLLDENDHTSLTNESLTQIDLTSAKDDQSPIKATHTLRGIVLQRAR